MHKIDEFEFQIEINDFIEGFKKLECDKNEFEKMLNSRFEKNAQGSFDRNFQEYVDAWRKNKKRYRDLGKILDGPDEDPWPDK